jgi:CheY-like chemotaxis protein
MVYRAALGAACGARPADSMSRIMSDSLRILVVEDEKALAHMIAMVLGGPASKIATAKNGWEALIKIGATARPFDVVITDHRMPRMTGIQLVQRLRKQNFGGKILVLSAHLSDEDIRAYEELNVDMMMSKPFDFDELQQAMAVLNKKASVLAQPPSAPLSGYASFA